jgi:hypothetical protein
MNKPVFRYFLLAALVLLAVVPTLAQDSDTSAFPLTIEHKFGTITLTATTPKMPSLHWGFSLSRYATGSAIKPRMGSSLGQRMQRTGHNRSCWICQKGSTLRQFWRFSPI